MTEKNNTWAAALRGNQPIEAVIKAGQQPQATTVRKAKLPAMHVGRGYRHGNMTWFPIFTDAQVADRKYVLAADDKKLQVVEQANPNVGSLMVRNDNDVNVLLLEGSLLEAGWQHRAVTRTVLVSAKSETEIPVVCVEAGRWNGQVGQKLGKRAAPARVRKAIRGIRVNDTGAFVQAAADQGAVWDEVRNFAAAVGQANATESLVDMKNQFDRNLQKLDAPKPLYGQRGVLIAVSGQPLAVEVFDHPDTFAERFETILDAYQAEAMAKPYVQCRSQSARDFVQRVEVLGVQPTEFAGRLRNKADKYVATEAVTTNTGEFLHLATLNARHELVLAA